MKKEALKQIKADVVSRLFNGQNLLNFISI